MTFTASALVLSWVAIVLLAFALAGVVARLRAVEDQLAGTGDRAVPDLVGRPAPAIDGIALGDGRDTLLLFVEGGCSSCGRVLPRAEQVTAGDPEVAVEVLWRGEVPSLPADEAGRLRHHGNQAAAHATYQVPFTPYGVVVGAGGRVLAAGAAGAGARIRQLLDDASAHERGVTP